MEAQQNKAFQKKERFKPSLWERILGNKPKANAIIEINNLLAEKDLMDIQVEDVQKIAFNYNIKLRKDFFPEILNIYKEYLRFCLEDKYLSKNEVKELKRLKELLSLTDAEVGKIHNEIAGELYKMEVEKAIEDHELSSDEKQFLKEIQSNLKISNALADKIYQSTANELLNKFMDEALSDKRLTQEEEEELNTIKNNLNIEVYMEASTRANYEKYKLFWQIENGKYPNFETDIGLDEGEPCYFYTDAEWLGQKVSPKSTDEAALRIKIAKGLHWKTENKEMKPVLEDIWATMDNGKVYLTPLRLILVGNEGTKYVQLENITDFSTYSNGINIMESDRNIFIQFKNHIDIFSMILGKAIMDL